MLVRVLARSPRLARSQRLLLNHYPLQIAFQTHQSRKYAKSNKPKRPADYKLPSTAAPLYQHGSLPPKIQSGTEGERTSSIVEALKESQAVKSPDAFQRQDEIRRAEQDGNTVPSPSSTETASSSTRSSFEPQYDKLQGEFETFPSAANNTTPQKPAQSAVDHIETRKEAGASKVPPLHDLTKGIPSTLDAELSDTFMKKSMTSELNLTEETSRTSAGGRGGRELPRSAYISSSERKRNKMANWMYAGFLVFSLSGTIYLGRDWETSEEKFKHPEAPSGWGLSLFYNRAKARLADTLDYYNEPAFPKLLPNTDPAWERPYTLVMSLEDLLVHSEWTRDHGWRMAKRPGVDYFLRYLSQYYELVIFTSVPSLVADPVIRKLDPYRIIMWPLFREATRYKNGEYIKDLAYLNRDLNKVIMLDTVPAHAKLQPENAIILPKWKGNPQDSELVSFIPFLEYLATMGFDDTREVLRSFEGKHIPSEFAHRESLAREKFQKQLAEDRAKRPRRSGVGFLGNALGMKPTSAGIDGIEQTLSEGFEQGKMLQDQIRERGQKQYEMIEKEIRENGEKWLKEMAVEEEKAKEEQMKGMQTTLVGVFGGSGRS